MAIPALNCWLVSAPEVRPFFHRGLGAFPILPIWLANQAEMVTLLHHCGAESALKSGSTIGAAVAAGAEASTDFSATEALATLIGSNVAVELGGSA